MIQKKFYFLVNKIYYYLNRIALSGEILVTSNEGIRSTIKLISKVPIFSKRIS